MYLVDAFETNRYIPSPTITSLGNNRDFKNQQKLIRICIASTQLS